MPCKTCERIMPVKPCEEGVKIKFKDKRFLFIYKSFIKLQQYCPCKECLVKDMCEDRCEEYKNHVLQRKD